VYISLEVVHHIQVSLN